VHPKSYDLSSLRLLGSVGEPINPAAWEWYYQHVGGGRCPIVDTFWQTETGGHMITPLPGVTPLVPGSCTLPFPGIQAAIVDETGNDVPNGAGRHPGRQEAVAVDDPHHLGRPRALQEELLPEDFKGKLLPGRRRRDPRRQDRATSRSPAASTTC
jgi:acetyl-CoA synthetase